MCICISLLLILSQWLPSDGPSDERESPLLLPLVALLDLDKCPLGPHYGSTFTTFTTDINKILLSVKCIYILTFYFILFFTNGLSDSRRGEVRQFKHNRLLSCNL